MLTLIFSILWWCLSDKRWLGITALVLSGIGVVFDGLSYGPLAVIDIAVFVINLILFIQRDKEGKLK